jgi:hypothetical protein
VSQNLIIIKFVGCCTPCIIEKLFQEPKGALVR